MRARSRNYRSLNCFDEPFPLSPVLISDCILPFWRILPSHDNCAACATCAAVRSLSSSTNYREHQHQINKAILCTLRFSFCLHCLSLVLFLISRRCCVEWHKMRDVQILAVMVVGVMMMEITHSLVWRRDLRQQWWRGASLYLSLSAPKYACVYVCLHSGAIVGGWIEGLLLLSPPPFSPVFSFCLSRLLLLFGPLICRDTLHF